MIFMPSTSRREKLVTDREALAGKIKSSNRPATEAEKNELENLAADIRRIDEASFILSQCPDDDDDLELRI